MPDNEQDWIEITVTRGVGFKGGSKKPGDTIQVPADNEAEGIPPVRWWEYTRKGFENPDVAKKEIANLTAEGVIVAPAKGKAA